MASANISDEQNSSTWEYIPETSPIVAVEPRRRHRAIFALSSDPHRWFPRGNLNNLTWLVLNGARPCSVHDIIYNKEDSLELIDIGIGIGIG